MRSGDDARFAFAILKALRLNRSLRALEYALPSAAETSSDTAMAAEREGCGCSRSLLWLSCSIHLDTRPPSRDYSLPLRARPTLFAEYPVLATTPAFEEMAVPLMRSGRGLRYLHLCCEMVSVAGSPCRTWGFVFLWALRLDNCTPSNSNRRALQIVAYLEGAAAVHRSASSFSEFSKW